MFGLASSVALTTATARADEPAAPSSTAESADTNAGDRATARALAQQGYEALRAKSYSTAADCFTRALAIIDAPTLRRDLARAQVGLGKLVDAHENYGSIIRKGVSDDAPPPWVKAVDDAKAEIGPVENRLAYAVITVTGPAHPRVTVDGAPIAEASLGVKRPMDPGRHEIRALGPGYHTAKKTIVLKDGESVKMTFELEDAPPDAAPKDEEESGKVSVATVVDPAWRKPLTITAFALGGAGLVVGSVAGVMAISLHGKLATHCTNRVCNPPDKAELDRFHTVGAISTIGFVAGGVTAGAGIVLLLVRPQVLVQKEPVKSTAQTGFRWAPFVSATGAGVEGTF